MRGQLVHPDSGDEEITVLSHRLRPSLGLYVLLIVIGWFVPLVAVIGYLVIAFFQYFPAQFAASREALPPAG